MEQKSSVKETYRFHKEISFKFVTFHKPRNEHCFLACSGINLTSISAGTSFNSDTKEQGHPRRSVIIIFFWTESYSNWLQWELHKYNCIIAVSYHEIWNWIVVEGNVHLATEHLDHEVHQRKDGSRHPTVSKKNTQIAYTEPSRLNKTNRNKRKSTKEPPLYLSRKAA